jgi:hypothetical protein
LIKQEHAVETIRDRFNRNMQLKLSETDSTGTFSRNYQGEIQQEHAEETTRDLFNRNMQLKLSGIDSTGTCKINY